MKKFLIAILLIALTVLPASAQTFKNNAIQVLGSSATQTTNLLPVADTIAVVLPTVAGTLEVVSTSALDTSGTSGVNTVKIIGLDTNWNEISETITMNGTTAQVSVNSYIRINKLQAVTVGSGGGAAGTITAYLSTAIFATISTGNVESQSAIYSVPANKYGFIEGWTVSAATSPTKFELKIREFGGAFNAIDKINLTSGPINKKFDYPLAVTQKSDIMIVAGTTTSTAAVAASFQISLEP